MTDAPLCARQARARGWEVLRLNGSDSRPKEGALFVLGAFLGASTKQRTKQTQQLRGL